MSNTTPREIYDMMNYDDDTKDPVIRGRLQCITNCDVIAAFKKYKYCKDRVETRDGTLEVCVEEYIDMVEAFDKCAGDEPFKKLV